jgi:D-3-phosphoglycerate dehydrogenase
VALYKEKIMKIAILDDYQDVVRHCQCFAMLKDHEVKVFNSSAVGIGQLAIRLAPFDALVLIRERTRFPRALLQRLPNLKLISQTGKVAGHIDLAAAREKTSPLPKAWATPPPPPS